MCRMLTWIVLLSMIGCKGNQPNMVPFMPTGPSLMPPPSTGTAGRTDPYYRPNSAPPPPAGPRVPTMSPAVPGGAYPTSQHSPAPPSQFATFTSEDGSAATHVADSRASYTAALPPSSAPPVASASAAPTPSQASTEPPAIPPLTVPPPAIGYGQPSVNNGAFPAPVGGTLPPSAPALPAANAPPIGSGL